MFLNDRAYNWINDATSRGRGLQYTNLKFSMPLPEDVDPTFRWEIRNRENGIGVHLDQFSSGKETLAAEIDFNIRHARTALFPETQAAYALRGFVSFNHTSRCLFLIPLTLPARTRTAKSQLLS